jgi:hypothetical protein
MQEEQIAVSTHRRSSGKWLAAGAFSIAIIAALIVGGFIYLSRKHMHQPPASPVPVALAQSVNFPIYYPVQAKLPAGYTLDLSSFKRPVQNGVSYSVSYSHSKKLVFSLQPKPSASELQNFTANYIPLHNSYQTPTGQALLGAYDTKTGTETLVSLPTGSNTWIIITAPYDISQDQLKQVLSSLHKN